MTPLVSICLANLNRRRFLEERMGTFFSQTLRDWELIVCDSYSNDGSWEFLNKFKNDPRVHLHQVPRKGIIPGLNECIQRAKGKYIYQAMILPVRLSWKNLSYRLNVIPNLALPSAISRKSTKLENLYCVRHDHSTCFLVSG